MDNVTVTTDTIRSSDNETLDIHIHIRRTLSNEKKEKPRIEQKTKRKQRPPQTREAIENFISRWQSPEMNMDTAHGESRNDAILLQDIFSHLPIFEEIVKFPILWRDCNWTYLRGVYKAYKTLPDEVAHRLEKLYKFWEKITQIAPGTQKDYRSVKRISGLWPRVIKLDEDTLESLFSRRVVFVNMDRTARESIKQELLSADRPIPAMHLALDDMITINKLAIFLSKSLKSEGYLAGGQLTWKDEITTYSQLVTCFVLAMKHHPGKGPTRIEHIAALYTELTEFLSNPRRDSLQVHATEPWITGSALSFAELRQRLGDNESLGRNGTISQDWLSIQGLGRGKEYFGKHYDCEYPVSLWLYSFFSSFFKLDSLDTSDSAVSSKSVSIPDMDATAEAQSQGNAPDTPSSTYSGDTVIPDLHDEEVTEVRFSRSPASFLSLVASNPFDETDSIHPSKWPTPPVHQTNIKHDVNNVKHSGQPAKPIAMSTHVASCLWENPEGDSGGTHSSSGSQLRNSSTFSTASTAVDELIDSTNVKTTSQKSSTTPLKRHRMHLTKLTTSSALGRMTTLFRSHSRKDGGNNMPSPKQKNLQSPKQKNLQSPNQKNLPSPEQKHLPSEKPVYVIVSDLRPC